MRDWSRWSLGGGNRSQESEMNLRLDVAAERPEKIDTKSGWKSGLEKWVQTTNFRPIHLLISGDWDWRKFEVSPHFSDSGSVRLRRR
jgi:hypothetical protein